MIMNYQLLAIYFISLCCISSAYEILKEIIRNTTNGQIRGIVVKSKYKAEVFFGVPYAEAPLGKLRFQYPQPSKNWNETRDCTKPKDMCYQFMTSDDRLKESEDCLYVNMITPDEEGNNNSKLSPVLVWIHGGSYSSDGANMFPVDGTVNNLVSKGIIVVFVNYRLGPLGFMSLVNETLPGNFGLEDQLAALQWVKDNIRYFNGNPQNVTLTGESAGASCASLLAMSPKSKGLFHRVMLRSGSALAPWSVNRETTIKNTQFLLQKLGCSIGNETEFKLCLQSASLRDIKNYVRMIITDLKTVVLFPSFTPIVDIFRSNHSILPYEPEKLIKLESRMPLLAGITSAESLGHLHALCRVWLIRNKIQNITKAEKFPYSVMKNGKPVTINWKVILPEVLFKNSELVYQSIQLKYFKNGILSESRSENLFIITQALSDYFMVSPLVAEAKYYAEKNLPVYLYRFRYKNDFLSLHIGICDDANEYTNDAFHGVDTALLFQSTAVLGYEIEFKQFSASDLIVTKLLSDQLVNFVKFGDPNGDNNQNHSWDLFSTRNQVALNFDADSRQIVVADNISYFWNDVTPIIEMLKVNVTCSDEAQ